MKAKYQQGQTLKATAAVQGAIERGELVTILSITRATGNQPWYHVKSASGKTAWLAESSLAAPLDVQ